MTLLELDHVVIFVSPEAPEAKALEAAGLQGFGGHTRHGDLGTASTSFFFSNVTYLELLYIVDEAACRRNIEPLSLDVLARVGWRETGALPFGLMLRRHAGDSDSPVPFPTKSLDVNGHPVHFSSATPAEPYYGVVPEPMSFRGYRADIADLPHPLGVKHLTGVTLTLLTAERSAIARLVEGQGIAKFETGSELLLTLTFDEGALGKSVDLRPTLPLRLMI